MPAFLLFLTLGCGQVNKEKYVAGDDPGDVNHANPVHEKGDETGDGFTREAQDGTNDAEVGPTPGTDSIRSDSATPNVILGQ
ncbi:MAG: hypothetical protein ICV83_18470 [Cytophagales bacterium]|nr:hypothetical protein [Cytophagales bacterium]